ncbi:hypothetical protein Tco_1032775 [Tanacetum coccineum]|uniref:Uncharacterized protein n=1 Tax=Tanacetum coccineum TaxID=301880 RepID=A0ABQ5GEE4_9ASTR
MSSEIKESQVYADYMTKYLQAQTNSNHGIGKGLMRKGDVLKPKKKKKDATPKRSKLITAEDNLLSDLDEALEYAIQVSIKKAHHQEKECRTKPRHVGIVLARQVNKEVNKGAAPESIDHSISFDDSFKSATDDKTESERESDTDASGNDSEHGDESDKSASDEESTESDESDNDFDNADDHNEDFVKEQEPLPKSIPTPSPSITTTLIEDYIRYMNDPKDVRMSKLLNEPIQTEATTMMVSLVLETIHEEQFTSPPPATPPTKSKTKKQRAKNLVQKYNKITHDDQDPEDHEGEKSNKRRRKGADESSSKKSKKIVEERVVQSWFNELVDAEEELEEYEYKDGFVTLFGKIVKKIFKKDNITKEDVDGPAFELLKGTYKNSIELEYNMDQCSLALTDKIDWINPEEYLVKGSKERAYALFITKIKATRYEDEGIKEMIPSLWSPSIQKYNRDVEFGICHWYPSR